MYVIPSKINLTKEILKGLRLYTKRLKKTEKRLKKALCTKGNMSFAIKV